MLSKCANPECSAPFLYLKRGQLFRIETSTGTEKPPDVDESNFDSKTSGRHLEYFWLCAECAPVLTLTFRRGVGVSTQPVARSKAVAANSAR